MEIRRTLVAGAIGAAFLASAVGCGAIADKAVEKGVEKGVEKAIESNSDCENVDLDGEGGISAECDGESVNVAGGDGAELPNGWPDDLSLPDGFTILLATSTASGLSVVGGVEGDLEELTTGIEDRLEGAGYSIEDRSEASTGEMASTSIRAEGADFEARVALTRGAGSTEGEITISYTLTPVAEG